ncbi:MAG TPA: EF-P beta-lysylation protein EpmB [Thermoguttaceae bacterium]|nr:EF-P beta-lysylation protein EpmB [Thermoguttaceae bacterium]
MTVTDERNAMGEPPAEGDWQADLAGAVRSAAELCRAVRLPSDSAVDAGDWPVLVPRPYLSRIAPGDPRDPLLLQVLPRREEHESPPGFSSDPLGETAAAPVPGLLWKYRGRSLIVTTGSCGVHCRFCFRRHFPLPASPPKLAAIEPALQRVERERSIHEVVLSGGDPLTFDDDHFGRLVARVGEIFHLRRLRIHTRMPIAIPNRVTERLVETLRASRLTTLVVVHVNHPAEIDASVEAALGRLVNAGIPVLSQSVLLRDVNDNVETLADLFEWLVDLRVMPYYLHQLDHVAGAAHFEVPESRGRKLVESLRARLPGYAVPRYVQEVPGASSKVWLG